jgi:tetratricopeptide (TPR) repeat protein
MKLIFSKNRKTKTMLTVLVFGIISFILPYLIISNLFFNVGTFMGERFVYSASIGMFIVMSTGIFWLHQKNKIVSFSIFSILFMYYTFKTIERNPDWKSNYTLYEADVEKVPNSARAQLFYGIELLANSDNGIKKTELNKSIKHLKKATEINPQFYHAHYNLGLAYQTANQHENAISAFKVVLKIEPKHINSHFYMGISLGKGLGQIPQSIEWMEKAIAVGYSGNDAYSNLGVAYGMNNQFDKALKNFLIALKDKPNDAKLLLNIGITYQQIGDEINANKYIEQAKSIDPSIIPN